MRERLHKPWFAIYVRVDFPAGRGIFAGSLKRPFFRGKAEISQTVLDKFQGIAVA